MDVAVECSVNCVMLPLSMIRLIMLPLSLSTLPLSNYTLPLFIFSPYPSLHFTLPLSVTDLFIVQCLIEDIITIYRKVWLVNISMDQ